MRYEEHYDIMKILTEETWQARTKLLEYMKTVTIDEKVPDIVPEVKEASTGLVAPHRGSPEVNLDGTHKVPYPEYTGPVTWEPLE